MTLRSENTVHATLRTAVCPLSAYNSCSHTKIHRGAHTRFTFPDSRLSRQQVYYFVLPHTSTHTNTRTHTTRRPCSSVHSSVVPLAALLWSFVHLSPSPFPLSHTPRQYHLRRTCRNAPNFAAYRLLRISPHPVFTHLLVDLRLTPICSHSPRRAHTRLPVANLPHLRLTPICSHSSQTRKHQVAGSQPSTVVGELKNAGLYKS